MRSKMTVLLGALLATSAPLPATAQDADARARATEAQMSDEERFRLLHVVMPIFVGPRPASVPDTVVPTAGWAAGVPRLGIPDLLMTDASLGIVNPLGLRPGDVATALPSGLSLAASFDPALARRAGATIGGEARAKGFNVLLAGGVNLTREWFGGRNFEYLGEDPLLAGTMAGEMIAGIQSQGVMSTVKHLVLNAQETQRRSLDARIGEAALRESDLLAFRLAIERGRPASVMCAYSLLNGTPDCGNAWLLDTVLKKEWRYPGWVMSDWGATYEAGWFNLGLDQQAGENLDAQVWFDKPLRDEVSEERVTRARLGDAVRRILRSMYAIGADRSLTQAPIDYSGNAAVAREAAAAGIVLLKNDGILPLDGAARRILVVGQFADRGVMSGGGSSNVVPVGGAAVTIPMGGPGFLAANGRIIIHPSSPLAALKVAFPKSTFEFDNGYFHESAAARAAKADLVIVFGDQWQTESLDNTTLALPQGQDALIAAVAGANPNTVVVLETGNPAAMPWLRQVRGVVEAWYSGQRGGEAIADVLSGRVNPSGRLPMTFPRTREQAPRSDVPGLGFADRTRVAADYVEGSDVGYRWYARKSETPLFAFGHGLSYTRFEHGPLSVSSGSTPTATFEVRNVGQREGADVPQLYLVARNGERRLRLAGFDKVHLRPGERRTVKIAIDPRLLASWESGRWTLAGGSYDFALGESADRLGTIRSVRLKARRWRDTP